MYNCATPYSSENVAISGHQAVIKRSSRTEGCDSRGDATWTLNGIRACEPTTPAMALFEEVIAMHSRGDAPRSFRGVPRSVGDRRVVTEYGKARVVTEKRE